jgi:hypothetical protein
MEWSSARVRHRAVRRVGSLASVETRDRKALRSIGAQWGVAKIELPEGWAGVAEPLRALMAEVEREAHVDRATPLELLERRRRKPDLQSVLLSGSRRELQAERDVGQRAIHG